MIAKSVNYLLMSIKFNELPTYSNITILHISIFHEFLFSRLHEKPKKEEYNMLVYNLNIYINIYLSKKKII